MPKRGGGSFLDLKRESHVGETSFGASSFTGYRGVDPRDRIIKIRLLALARWCHTILRHGVAVFVWILWEFFMSLFFYCFFCSFLIVLAVFLFLSYVCCSNKFFLVFIVLLVLFFVSTIIIAFLERFGVLDYEELIAVSSMVAYNLRFC